jgi:MraZ protein
MDPGAPLPRGLPPSGGMFHIWNKNRTLQKRAWKEKAARRRLSLRQFPNQIANCANPQGRPMGRITLGAFQGAASGPPARVRILLKNNALHLSPLTTIKCHGIPSIKPTLGEYKHRYPQGRTCGDRKFRAGLPRRLALRVLVGQHVNKIDRKGRVSVPKQFRDGLQAQGGSFVGVYVYPSFKEATIEACGEVFMERVAGSLDRHSMFSEDQDELAAVLLESAHQLPFDPEGRIVLPQVLIEHASLDGEALFAGRGDRFQIWQPAAYRDSRAQIFERLKTRKPTLQLDRPAGGA